jgi:pimeloyl-ACP methyl ester carboxylesterase
MELEETTLGPLPVLVGGDGPPLLYLGGLLPVAGVDTRLVRRAAEVSLRPLADIRRGVYANRRPGLQDGTTMAQIAADHAEAILALESGPVDVVGVSTGGSIAQQLAVDHPQLVRRLVLISTGCRLTPETRGMQARIAADVRRGRPERAVISAAVDVLFPPLEAPARLLAPLLSSLVRGLGDLSDLAVTIEAEDVFDLGRAAGTIQAPTLIVCGARDRFYPRPLLEETQRLIPGSQLQIVPRRGHLTAVGSERAIAAVRGFLQYRSSGAEP